MGAAKHEFEKRAQRVIGRLEGSMRVKQLDDDATKRAVALLEQASGEVSELLEAGEALARYADTCELLLKEAGYQGKAESLRARVSAWIAAAKKATGAAA